MRGADDLDKHGLDAEYDGGFGDECDRGNRYEGADRDLQETRRYDFSILGNFTKIKGFR